MALLAPCNSELVPESWLAPSHLTHSDDLWAKFDFENERTLVLPNPSPSNDSHLASFFDMGASTGGFGGCGFPPTGALPTPPHSPPTEHDLDDLVASIPEILETRSSSPPSAISEILSDLEGMEAASPPLKIESVWGNADWWWANPITPNVEASIKRDIMWGGGGGGTCTANCNSTSCNPSCAPGTVTTTTTTTTGSLAMPLVEIKKERQDSESSTEAACRDVMHADDLSDDDSDGDDLPDTPSCTDSDCDGDDPISISTWPSRHHHHHHQVPTTVTHYTTTSSAPTTVRTTATPSVNNEHNYCGRVPDLHHSHHIVHHPQHTTGTITPSDTEDEVDVVSCSEQDSSTTSTTTTPTTTTTRLHLPPPTPTPTTTTTPTKGSVDVKRQLQLAIQEAVRNRQNKIVNSGNDGDSSGDVTTTTTTTTTAAAARLVSVKIKTQGKPAAYTKRMRDYHSEVVKSTKHRRRNKGESDEGRRSVHNSLERQRRVDLRNAFEYLRQLVPDTKILEKAPKVQILKKAALHCKSLQNTELRLLREKEELRRQLKELQHRRSLCS